MAAQPQSPTKKSRIALPDPRLPADDVLEAEQGGGMRAEDVAFLIDCLQNTVGGQVQIDCQAVAKKRNLINHRSVANRISTIRRKYSMPLVTSAVKNAASAAAVEDDGVPATPKSTPSRAPKRKTTGADGGSPTKKIASVKEEEEAESIEEKVFGKPDEVEEPVTPRREAN